MIDYEYVFVTALHAELKKRVIGGIYINVIDDKLNVRIVREKDMGFNYDYIFDDTLSHMIINGASAKNVARSVVNKYGEFVYNKCFK